MATYHVTLKDAEGYDIAKDYVDGLPQAKERARYLLSDKYARSVETTVADLGAVKAEVALGNVCLWDVFA